MAAISIVRVTTATQSAPISAADLVAAKPGNHQTGDDRNNGSGDGGDAHDNDHGPSNNDQSGAVYDYGDDHAISVSGAQDDRPSPDVTTVSSNISASPSQTSSHQFTLTGSSLWNSNTVSTSSVQITEPRPGPNTPWISDPRSPTTWMTSTLDLSPLQTSSSASLAQATSETTVFLSTITTSTALDSMISSPIMYPSSWTQTWTSASTATPQSAADWISSTSPAVLPFYTSVAIDTPSLATLSPMSTTEPQQTPVVVPTFFSSAPVVMTEANIIPVPSPDSLTSTLEEPDRITTVSPTVHTPETTLNALFSSPALQIVPATYASESASNAAAVFTQQPINQEVTQGSSSTLKTLPSQIVISPSPGASSAAAALASSNGQTTSSDANKPRIAAGVTVGMVIAVSLLIIGFVYLRRRSLQRKMIRRLENSGDSSSSVPLATMRGSQEKGRPLLAGHRKPFRELLTAWDVNHEYEDPWRVSLYRKEQDKTPPPGTAL